MKLMSRIPLRGVVEWRHPNDDQNQPGIRGECFAGEVEQHGWYVVWSSYAVYWIGGGSWTTDLACFTALDETAAEILRWATPRRAPCWPSSPWNGACDFSPFARRLDAA